MTFPADSSRARVLAVLRAATGPLPAVEISRLARLPIQQARNRLSEMHRARQIVNVGNPKNATYRLTDAEESVPVELPPPIAHWREAGLYGGEKPLPMRPGSLDFLRCQSLDNGERRDWVRPVLISAPSGAVR